MRGMKNARWVPGLAALKSYKASFLPHDLAAGLTLGAVMVPVGLAYGALAGLPLAGLYGSMLPLIAYALFGSSRLLIVGPDTAMAAIVAVAVAPLAGGDAGRLALFAAGLGVMTGVLCLLAGLLRLGFVANFLSKPVIVGFMHGLAVVVAVAQLPRVLGIRSAGETALEQLLNALPQLGHTTPSPWRSAAPPSPSSCSAAVSCRACRARSWRWSPRAWPSCCSTSSARVSP